ncbi:hypothetical protein D3C77_260120 [compost metagenome]
MDLIVSGVIEIVLAHAPGNDPFAQAGRFHQRLGIEVRVFQQVFQIARGAGVEVHAAAVEHQRQRGRVAHAQAIGAQKTIFDTPYRHISGGGTGFEIGRFACGPDQHLALPGGDIGYQGRAVFGEAQAAPAAAEKTPDVVLLMALDPQHDDVAGELRVLRFLARQLPGHRQCVGELPGQRIDVTAITHIGRRHQLHQVRPRLAPGDRHAVVGQAPAGVERQAKTGHRNTLDQRLEPGLAGADVHPPGAAGQRCPRHRAGLQGNAPRSRCRQQATGLVPTHAVGVDAHAHFGIGVLCQSRIKHANVIRLGQAAAGDGVVARGLVHHQHQGALAAQWISRVQIRGIVVLADAAAAHQRNQLAGAVQLGGGQFIWRLEDVFQQRRTIGEVVDTHRVDHQRHRCVALDAQRR